MKTKEVDVYLEWDNQSKLLQHDVRMEFNKTLTKIKGE